MCFFIDLVSLHPLKERYILSWLLGIFIPNFPNATTGYNFAISGTQFPMNLHNVLPVLSVSARSQGLDRFGSELYDTIYKERGLTLIKIKHYPLASNALKIKKYVYYV